MTAIELTSVVATDEASSTAVDSVLLTRVLDMLNQARAFGNQRNWFEAERLCLEASTLAAQEVGKVSSIYGLCLEDLGVMRICQGKRREAEVTLTEALDILQAALGADHGDVARVFGRLHELYNS